MILSIHYCKLMIKTLFSGQLVHLNKRGSSKVLKNFLEPMGWHGYTEKKYANLCDLIS